jgi:DNA primase
MILPAAFIEELKARTTIADVIGRRMRLVRQGREFLGCCPFHKEKTPSFRVYEDHFHCFGCGAHGSAIDFVMRSEGLGFREAVERLAAEAGLAVPAQTPESEALDRKRRSLFDVNEAACRYFEKMLRMPEGAPARTYLRGRGLDDAIIERFRLGFAPEGRTALKAVLAREDLGEDLLVEAGLLIAPEESARSPFDRFRGRVMFPIADGGGRIAGFGGRLLADGEPKYLNSPETPVFSKGRLLYGLAQALPAAREAGTVIAVEGYMDVIACARAGIDHVVAPLGTALTEDQLRQLWRMAAEPVICFDGDQAGRRAALRVAELALPAMRAGLGLRFASLPEGQDPDSLITAGGADAVAPVLAAAVPLSEFLWRKEAEVRPLVTPEDWAAFRRRLRDHAGRINDRDLAEEFRETWYAKLRAVRGTGRGAGRGQREKQQARLQKPALRGLADQVAVARVDPLDNAARTLLAIIINHPAFFHEVEDDFGSVCFADGGLDGLRQELIPLLSGGEDLTSDDLRQALAASPFAQVVSALLSDPLIRSLRGIGADATAEGLRSIWKANFADLTRAALQAELAAADHADDPSDDAWQRRLAQRRQVLEIGDED